MVLKYLLEKEVKQFMRNPIFPRIVLIFPLVILLVMPWATTFEVEDVNVVIVDNDNTSLSSRLAHKIEGSHYFNLVGVEYSYGTAIDKVEKQDADLILEIPDGFELSVINGTNANYQVSANAVNGVKGNLGMGYINMVMGDFITDVKYNDVNDVQEMNIITRNLYNAHLDYKRFMVPALIIMVIIVICGFLPALNIVNEKETGTIGQINVTPVGKWTFILAKLLPYWCIGFIAISIGFAVAWIVYGFVPVGKFITIYAVAALFILIMSSIGLIISNYSSTMQQAMFVMFFVVVIFMLMSGLFTPVSSMPEWAQWIAFFNPPRHFVEAMRSVYLKGGTFTSCAQPFMMLSTFATITTTWAILSYSKRE